MKRRFRLPFTLENGIGIDVMQVAENEWTAFFWFNSTRPATAELSTLIGNLNNDAPRCPTRKEARRWIGNLLYGDAFPGIAAEGRP